MHAVRASGRRESIDVVFELLSDRHRRTLCRYVMEVDRTVFSVDELATALAEGDPSVDRERLEVELVHVHLPTLADRGVLEYDARSATVRLDDERFASLCVELESVAADVCPEVD